MRGMSRRALPLAAGATGIREARMDATAQTAPKETRLILLGTGRGGDPENT